MSQFKKPRILYYDVETSPVLAWIWRTGYKISVSHDQIKKGQKFDIICICYKWDHENKIHSLDWGLHKQDSEEMIEKFTTIIEQADIVVAHNGDKFDTKQINTQRLLLDKAPINWPSTEDTLKQFRKYFAFPSYKLDYLAKTLLGCGKHQMGFQDWIDIVEGKKAKALTKMIDYCKKDVRLLAQMFNKAKPFFKPKIHVGVMNGMGRNSCPSCGSVRSKSNGMCYTACRAYQRRMCLNCGRTYARTS